MNEWKPIETLSPDDEEKTIILYADGKYGVGRKNYDDDEDDRWYVYDHYHEKLYAFFPTHWMIPEPPAETGK